MWVFLLARVVLIIAEKSLALTQQQPERQFLQERIRQLRQKKTRQKPMRILR
jgi:hypothetical protein